MGANHQNPNFPAQVEDLKESLDRRDGARRAMRTFFLCLFCMAAGFAWRSWQVEHDQAMTDALPVVNDRNLSNHGY